MQTRQETEELRITQSQQQSEPNILGRLNVKWLMLVYIPILILTPVYTYRMAIKQDPKMKFPHATVTQTACNYPQDIVARLTMLVASSILALVYYMIFRWTENEAKRVKFPRHIGKFHFYLMEFSIGCYAITIGTFDGKSTGPLHGPCAVIFFIILLLEVINTTLFLTELRDYDTSVMSLDSLHLKQLLAAGVSGVWVYCLAGLALAGDSLEGKGDKYVVIVEWNTVFICLVWLLTFAAEWKRLDLCLDMKLPNHSGQTLPLSISDI